MLDVMQIVNWMRVRNYYDLQTDDPNVEELTQMKAMKLLYYMQAASLVINNRQLFKDDIVAWKYGPAVARVHQKYKNRRRIVGKIGQDDIKDYQLVENTANDISIVRSVYRRFSTMSAYDLMQKTHREKPWKETPQSKIISTDKIKEYFTKKKMNETINKSVMDSIDEAIDDMHDHHLRKASSYDELEKILNE